MLLRIMRDKLKQQIRDARNGWSSPPHFRAIETTSTNIMIADADFNIVRRIRLLAGTGQAEKRSEAGFKFRPCLSLAKRRYFSIAHPLISVIC